MDDRDLVSIQEARTLAHAARAAQIALAELTQAEIDSIVESMANAATQHAEALARMAVDETGYGVAADKVQKNLFSSKQVYEFIKPIKTVGIVNELPDRRVVEIAEPFGVVAAIVPSTNPTSTAIYKVLIALKARCAVIVSPHPKATRCITRAVQVMAEAANNAGAPSGSIGWMNTVTLEGTQELMRHRDVSVILATGGMGLVRSAYSAGKPAYGVGPGNAPSYIESSADLKKAAKDIVIGKTFDNGVLCSSPNSIVVDEVIESEVRRELINCGAYFLNKDEINKLGKALVTPQRLPSQLLVGKTATYIAKEVGLTVPDETSVLIAPLEGVGRDHPLSIEKLCPVLSYYVVRDWREGCERCKEILKYGGMGHTMSIHSKDEQVILEFGLKKPASRICVNTPTTHGSVGLTTGLDPAMTLGCGGWGGNITSDNISPKHLLNIKRLAYELRPAVRSATLENLSSFKSSTERVNGPGTLSPSQSSTKPSRSGISTNALTVRIDRFLKSHGYEPENISQPKEKAVQPKKQVSVPKASPVDFVSEEEVRAALKTGQKLLIGNRTIVTPAARELGEEKKIFIFE